MQTFIEWLDLNEITGIYPPLYDGLSAYPDAYFVNSSYQVYINASLKAKTNPPQTIKENNENPQKVDFLSFSKTGEIKVLVDGQKITLIIDGFYIDKFKESSYRNPIETYKKLQDWIKKGFAQEI